MVIRQRECVAGVPVTARQGEMASRDEIHVVCFSVDNLEKLICFFVACPDFSFVCILGEIVTQH